MACCGFVHIAQLTEAKTTAVREDALVTGRYLAVIMVTQCNVDSMSVLCAAYFKDRKVKQSILLNHDAKP